jgi:hypothetical protein
MPDGPGSDVFVGLNQQEYIVSNTITLKWCEVTMHRMLETVFHVADALPYDVLLGGHLSTRIKFPIHAEWPWL